jgi:hypothetical protein
MLKRPTDRDIAMLNRATDRVIAMLNRATDRCIVFIVFFLLLGVLQRYIFICIRRYTYTEFFCNRIYFANLTTNFIIKFPVKIRSSVLPVLHKQPYQSVLHCCSSLALHQNETSVGVATNWLVAGVRVSIIAGNRTSTVSAVQCWGGQYG